MEFKISKKAGKQLLKIDTRYQTNIIKAIKRLPEGDIVKLTGCIDQYRLRVGYFRILFTMQKDIIEIYKVEKRGDVYK
jgi:mRNA interferase RelE/StbE